MFMIKKNIQGLDHMYYYIQDLDTTFVLIGFEMSEQVGNVVYYKFAPVYGPYTELYFLQVAYFESFDEARKKYGVYLIEDIDDVKYDFMQ